MYEPTDIVTTEAEVRAVIPGVIERQVRKVIDHIDDHIRVWIERLTQDNLKYRLYDE